ncbi:hypothetical protein [Chamaesiphon minutus]|uniref:Uncharacterized protein n=1 Tax=Chamaesiphon minutus (strain ATCC 27169 / PCC 6605) TaxID=1173020 RepID=K9UQ02_CHAP6|nr:hypothetical protein [Chamaesiphon minutus]AFY97162.1 hypothetical protein Cha6605_6339 [Chamaesiphon minutus PCC 6605]
MNILQEIQRASSSRDPILAEHLDAIDRRLNEHTREDQMLHIGFEIEDYPTAHLLYLHRAILYLDCWSRGFDAECGEFDEPFEFDFEEDLETCLKLNPSCADAHYVKATVVEQIHDDLQGAKNHYVEAMKHDKRKFGAICNQKIKSFDRAQRQIERAERADEREFARWQQSLAKSGKSK